MTRPLALTDHQLAEIKSAAATLDPSARSRFLEGIARRLGSEPTDIAVSHAIAMQLAINRIPAFLRDSKTGVSKWDRRPYQLTHFVQPVRPLYFGANKKWKTVYGMRKACAMAQLTK